ncbi:hypothetical protein ACFV0H_28665 [Streptomyces erythrochromogenes]|uniref:hypothetical protein n=1 Tax=Streptomyces erythrochromogenes TaxID=285574 RepID=UPI0036C5B686
MPSAHSSQDGRSEGSVILVVVVVADIKRLSPPEKKELTAAPGSFNEKTVALDEFVQVPEESTLSFALLRLTHSPSPISLPGEFFEKRSGFYAVEELPRVAISFVDLATPNTPVFEPHGFTVEPVGSFPRHC